MVWEAIRSPSVWENVFVTISYDEHRSIFDHVEPPTLRTAPPPGVSYAPFETPRAQPAGETSCRWPHAGFDDFVPSRRAIAVGINQAARCPPKSGWLPPCCVGHTNPGRSRVEGDASPERSRRML